MGIRITILCDNIVPQGGRCIGEHGFSAIIERDGETILFDTGQGQALTYNAKMLGVNLNSATKVVLSHGHYDHTGGLKDFLQQTGKVSINAHPDIFQAKYAYFEGNYRYIGIPFARDAINGWGAHLDLSDKPVEIIPGVMTTGEVVRRNPDEGRDRRLLVKEKDTFREDRILDDLSLIIDDPKGQIILLGCAHAGLMNIIDHVKSLTGRESFLWIIGGTHLGFYEEERLNEIIKELKASDIKNIGVSHCTGLQASYRLSQELGQRFQFCTVGSVIEV